VFGVRGKSPPPLPLASTQGAEVPVIGGRGKSRPPLPLASVFIAEPRADLRTRLRYRAGGTPLARSILYLAAAPARLPTPTRCYMNLKRLALICAGIAVLFATASPAAAIPAFARKYRVSCSLCHSAPPKLNEFGENFAAQGFELAPGAAPVDTIDTGDALLQLPAGLPLAVRMDLFAELRTGVPADATRLDLQTPWNIKLLSGGPLGKKVSYYMYFFLGERGEVAGLEDAYVQFTDIGSSGISLMVGQFQVSDPLFKRELRLTVEDYQPYRVRVGDARPDLTYERGLMAFFSPWEGADVTAAVVNGNGLSAASEQRVFDSDNLKNFAGRFSQSVGPLRIGAFGYIANQEKPDAVDEIVVWGPDATLTLGAAGELSAQFLRRTDDDPFFRGEDVAETTTVDAAMAELVLWPQGPTGRLFFSGIFNWINADEPLFTVRAGEDGLLEQYTYGAAGVSWLLQRNLRLSGEAGWDFEREGARLTLGMMAAF
jgi:hypothetical protein